MTPAKVFSEMKDSGILGCGSIPSHWETIPLKYVALLDGKVDVSNIAPEDMVSFAPMECVRNDKRIPRTALKSKDNGTYSSFGNGDIAIAKVTPCFENGNICMMESLENGYAFGSSELFSVRPQKIVGRYLFYSLQTPYFLDGGAATMTGVGGLKRVSSYYMKNVKIVLPPLSEQSAIAAYLDTQCAKIDEIIVQAKASIEDYKQWKASIIYEAVTKGLDPNVEMKDSGIEWIGRMPSDWAIIRVKNLLTEINDRSETGSEEPLSMSQVLGIVPSSTIAVANPATSYVGAKIVQPNDLVFNKLKAHLGVFAVSNYDGLVSPDYAVYRANERANPKFLEYLFKTPNCIQEFKKYITGVGAGLSRLYTSDLFNIKVALPVIDVQKHIIEYLNDFCSQADALIGEKQSLIDDLESYKKSLIYEVVTGKRRVENISEITISILSPEVLRYRKALLMLRVLDLLGDDTRGRIQLQKCMFAAECLLNMPFHTQFIRYKHGPYDPELLNLEAILSRKGWYTILKGSPVTYQKGEQFGEGLQEYMNIFSDIDLKLEKIVGFLKPMKTSQAERVATLLAVWNDFIIDGILQPTDKEIINEVVTHWTPNKANPQYSTWQNTLYKMRENQFVPKGTGVHTQQKKSQQER